MNIFEKVMEFASKQPALTGVGIVALSALCIAITSNVGSVACAAIDKKAEFSVSYGDFKVSMNSAQAPLIAEAKVETA